jgi:hypothetical protein
MKSFWRCYLALAGVTSLTEPAVAQSAFALCADTLPNRIVSTGPARVITTTVDGLRVCLAAEGFTDADALHPRDWRSPSRLVVLETSIPGDARRMQETPVLTWWKRNEQSLPNDSLAATWRAAVIDVAAAQWDVAARRMERRELSDNISSLLAQKAWIQGQIDTLRQRDDSLRIAVGERLSQARLDKQRALNSATQSESAARSNLSKAQSSLAAATSSGDPGRIQSARAAVAAAEDRVRTATDRVRAAQAIVPEHAVSGTQLLRDELDANGRIATLSAMLAELDAGPRVAAWQSAIAAIEAQPDPEVQLRSAAARLRAILTR